MPRPIRALLAALLLSLAAACNQSPGGGSDLSVPRDLLSPSGPDLAPPPDLATAADIATGTDLAGSPADLAPPRDLARPMDLAGASEPCSAAGATVGMQLCCNATGDFPNLCAIGACGCAPMNSHMVRVCQCPNGRCWNGNACQ